MKRALFLVTMALLVGASVFTAAQAGPVSIATNLFKFFLGLVNVEFELQLLPQVSIHLFAEYLVGEVDHPDLVVHIGPRYYPFSNEPHASGLFLGLSVGYGWSNTTGGDIALGAEAGWKATLNESLFLLPRALLAYPVRAATVLPGFEVLVGATLQP